MAFRQQVLIRFSIFTGVRIMPGYQSDNPLFRSFATDEDVVDFQNGCRALSREYLLDQGFNTSLFHPVGRDIIRTRLFGLLAEDAIAVQDASNISGIAQSFAKNTANLMTLIQSSSEVALHPITNLWLYKMYSLAWTQFSQEQADTYSDSLRRCSEMVARAKTATEIV
jgi:hypothetical protein